MSKGGIYYTDFHVSQEIMTACLDHLKRVFTGEIVSVSLNKPVDLGTNVVLKGAERSYPTMVKQVVIGLEKLTTNYVYFLEHDVLYHLSHFDFVPSRDDLFYYNVNNWRWDYPYDHLITYGGLTSLSMLCCSRELALDHYRRRLAHIYDSGLSEIKSGEPTWVRQMGYEPGTKPRRRGGFSDEGHEKWRSEYPNIDIRHRQTYSPPKVYLKNFKHQPEEWREGGFEDVSFWDLPSRFGLKQSAATWNYCWWSGETTKGAELA